MSESESSTRPMRRIERYAFVEEILPVYELEEPQQDLALNTGSDKAPAPAKPPEPPKIVNLFVGGLGDSRYLAVKSYYDEKKSVLLNPQYFTQDQRGKIINYIKSLPEGSKINLIGHSWGGDTAAEAAVHSGRKINLLITIDPVSYFPPSFVDLKDQTNTWVDVNATAKGYHASDLASFFGNGWGDSPSKYADLYISAPMHHAYFGEMMQYVPPGGKSPEQILLDANHW